MTTKMKGLFKGIRHISQIFDEEQEKEQDLQIGLPTDVKHVAHVGWDGSATEDSTKGMTGDSQSNKGERASEDAKRGQRTKKSQQQGEGEGPKSSRRRSTDTTNSTDTSPPRRPSRRLSADNATAAARPSRRNQAKDLPDVGGGDAPKKTRRKKSESIEGGSRRSKCKSAGLGDATAVESGSDTAAQKPICQSSEDEEREKV